MANKKKLSLRTLVFNDKSLILVALFLAVVVWVVTSLNIGTDENTTITVHTPIRLSDELSEQLGMEYYSLQDAVDIKVTISGAKYIVGQVKDSDLGIKFDTSSVNRAGAQSVPIIVTNKSKTKDFKISSVNPSSIDAYFDVQESKDFDITLVYDKDVAAEGYVFGTPVVTEESVTVTGPKTYVDRIETVNAEATFDKKELKETTSVDCELVPYGSGVESNYLTITRAGETDEKLTSIPVQFPVLKDEYLPISVNLTDSPNKTHDNDVKIDYSSDYLHVGILENADVTTAQLGNISYHDLKVGKNEFSFNTNKMQGVILLDDADKKVKVTVSVSDYYERIEVPIKPTDVNVEGAGDNAKPRVRSVSKGTVSVIVPKGTELTASDLKIKADVSKKASNNKYKLSISVSDKSSWVYSDYMATVIF